MTREELIEKAISLVDKRLASGYIDLEDWIPHVVALVLDEAAKVVRRMPSPSSEWMADELLRALPPVENTPQS